VFISLCVVDTDAGLGAGFDCLLRETNMRKELWGKFVPLSAFGGTCCFARETFDVVVNDGKWRGILDAALHESFAVANADLVQRGEQTLDVEEGMKEILKLWGSRIGAKPSMLVDLEHNRRLELQYLSGYVVDRGREMGVPTPMHEKFLTSLMPFVKGEVK
jgi:2-dehydropantoate 2-reductase